MTDFDLVTLGAGSGGIAAARRAALHGAKVAIVEGRRVGGTCVLRGCVPKKLLVYAAQHADDLAEARGYGWELGPTPTFSMARWQQAKAAETARLEGVYRQLLAASGVELIEGWAHLQPGRDGAPHAVRVGERRLTARHVIVATGSRPSGDTLPGIELCASSDDLLDLAELPASAAFIGGGYIAVEFASLFARLGVPVCLYFRDSLPLRGFDPMLRAAAAAALQAAGVELHPGVVPQRVMKGDGTLLLAFGDDRVREFPWVLNATGRKPNAAGLGLACDGRGAIPVDDRLQTEVPGVYAIGDVTARKPLTPVAIAEGRAVADMLFAGSDRTVDLRRVASATFMLPPIGTVGPTEPEALAAGHDLKVYETDFRPMRSAFVGSDARSRMKLLVDAHDDTVLAVHMIGPDAPEIVQSLAVALTAGATKADFDRTIAVHPTAAEEFVLMREPMRTVKASSGGPATG
ncbi:FAD-dependent oxidoreductase [Aquabacterium sp. J223]|uniref:FAD-dependent oxidoreductase n=1 Tax=Aquabacterium sp. J223 TaxID=2898431 RepID=UPI0021ADFE69|nr:FAD-dependent oxidoreductase [Aquabacterium sp. J223]UUX97227.1 FAD-dependent oxidoreductase [Aquabacterium sp. J223]